MDRNNNSVPVDIGYEPTETQKSTDQYLQVLNSKHRRQTLRYLKIYNNPSVEEIAAHLRTLSSAEGEDQLEIELVHNHLPALREQGLLSFDARSKTVSSEPLPDFAEELIALTTETVDEESER